MEESGLTVRPKELERMILELSVNFKMDEMKLKCAEYITPRYFKKLQSYRKNTFSKDLFEFVKPSGKAILTRGDSDKLNPEII